MSLFITHTHTLTGTLIYLHTHSLTCTHIYLHTLTHTNSLSLILLCFLSFFEPHLRCRHPTSLLLIKIYLFGVPSPHLIQKEDFSRSLRAAYFDSPPSQLSFLFPSLLLLFFSFPPSLSPPSLEIPIL